MIFVETPPFERVREDYLDNDQFRLLQLTLLVQPAIGTVIPGSGGVRKMRWGVPSRGKRGGLRVIYYWMRSPDEIHLLPVYDKTDQVDLSRDQVRAMRAVVKQIQEQRR
ncbi:MAG: type II toxin-antitoxin system RelE/ParE family toxin [Gammaproteobacteria bacterium]|nr:type II toxin-antitoxin system RelE/ParE family toxin [Gammaproteobacteria bacterium]